ncbi:MAG TPA: ABC transporter ATP-binding protein [Acidimicrobiia bacterium]|nr:ABC transporter ATP-binding protein [Acidimicrobiia bacterium]
MPPAIQVAGVSKRFRLSHETYHSLKERVVHFGRTMSSEDFWALRDIELTIAQGETYGLLGHNGSGKSTLLKLIGGILAPTSGEIRVAGRIAALLELGAGFHPELTGRENIFMNGSILGLSRREIERRFDEIVGFAELEQFIDMQVRNYSSGMYVRLGFAVAVNVDPDILLVDEVLAVGDESFQRKCLDRVRQFQREGRTIVVVSHGADLIRQVCNRAAVLDHGQLVFVGKAGEAVRVMRRHVLGDDADGGEVPEVPIKSRVKAGPDGPQVKVTNVVLDHPGVPDRRYLLAGEPLTIRLQYRASEPVADAEFVVTLYDAENRVLYAADSGVLGVAIPRLADEGEVAFVIDHLPLLDGRYTFSVGVRGPGVLYDWQERQYSFEVMNPGSVLGYVDVAMRFEARDVGAAGDAEGRAVVDAE